MSLLEWLRSRLASPGRPKRIAGFGTAYDGPFDAPPAEPVELDPDLPWELRE